MGVLPIADFHQDMIFVDGILERLYRAGYRLVVGAVWPLQGGRVWDYGETLEGVRWFWEEVKRSPNSNVLLNWRDINPENLNLVIGLEGGYLRDLRQYEELYKRGVRLFGLTWNVDSELATSCCGDKGGRGGLTSLGREFLHWAKETGVLVDVAHASYDTIYEVLESGVNLIYSHGGILEKPFSQRILSPTLAGEIVGRGGVVGVGYGGIFFPDADLNALANLIQDLYTLLGGGVVSGSDFFGLGGSEFKGLEKPEDIHNLLSLLPDGIRYRFAWGEAERFIGRLG